MKTNFLLAIALGFAFSGALIAVEPVDIEPYRAAAIKRWETEIAKLEALDQSESHPDDSILFIGSSSIRLWDDIASDMAPYHPIQRGFGGSQWSDVAVFAERLIAPHRVRAAVFFVGNDIAGREGDKTPEEVAGIFAYVRERVEKLHPGTPVFYVAVTPTHKRFAAWPQIRSANNAVRDYCENTEDTYFIGTESIYLDAEGQPKPELFREDQLHQSREGYVLWTAAIKSQLDTVLGGAD